MVAILLCLRAAGAFYFNEEGRRDCELCWLFWKFAFQGAGVRRADLFTRQEIGAGSVLVHLLQLEV
jgi:hypothetical protein